jgi:hypothetical protein
MTPWGGFTKICVARQKRHCARLRGHYSGARVRKYEPGTGYRGTPQIGMCVLCLSRKGSKGAIKTEVEEVQAHEAPVVGSFGATDFGEKK